MFCWSFSSHSIRDLSNENKGSKPEKSRKSEWYESRMFTTASNPVELDFFRLVRGKSVLNCISWFRNLKRLRHTISKTENSRKNGNECENQFGSGEPRNYRSGKTIAQHSALAAWLLSVANSSKIHSPAFFSFKKILDLSNVFFPKSKERKQS